MILPHDLVLRVQMGDTCQGSARGTISAQQMVAVMMPLGRKRSAEWGSTGSSNLIEPPAGCFSEKCL